MFAPLQGPGKSGASEDQAVRGPGQDRGQLAQGGGVLQHGQALGARIDLAVGAHGHAGGFGLEEGLITRPCPHTQVGNTKDAGLSAFLVSQEACILSCYPIVFPLPWAQVRCLCGGLLNYYNQGGRVRDAQGREVQAIHPGAPELRQYITRPNNFKGPQAAQ